MSIDVHDHLVLLEDRLGVELSDDAKIRIGTAAGVCRISEVVLAWQIGI
jgi:acyl carrier protein